MGENRRPEAGRFGDVSIALHCLTAALVTVRLATALTLRLGQGARDPDAR